MDKTNKKFQTFIAYQLEDAQINMLWNVFEELGKITKLQPITEAEIKDFKCSLNKSFKSE